MKKVKYVLRPLEERDLELRVEWMNNPRINSTMSFELPITIEGTRKWFEKVSKQTNRYDFCLERDTEVVAMTGFKIDSLGNAETYTFVDPKLLGKGIGRVARFACSAKAFDMQEVSSLFSIVNSDNKASIKLCELLGFMVETNKTEVIVRNNQQISRLYYICSKEGFNSNLFDYHLRKGKVYIYEKI